MANLKIVTEVLPTVNSVPAGRMCVQSSTPILPLTPLHECRPVHRWIYDDTMHSYPESVLRWNEVEKKRLG